MDRPLEVLSDRSGAIILGWIDRHVLYIRFAGEISGTLGQCGAEQLRKLLADQWDVICFADASSPETVDFTARSAMVRAILAHRSQFKSIFVLTRSVAVTSTARVVARLIGDTILITEDLDEFAAKLLKVAPYSARKLNPKSWRQCQPSECQKKCVG